jgi:hypothetical protein
VPAEFVGRDEAMIAASPAFAGAYQAIREFAKAADRILDRFEPGSMEVTLLEASWNEKLNQSGPRYPVALMGYPFQPFARIEKMDVDDRMRAVFAKWRRFSL